MSDGFVDLRLNTQEGQVQESFWPSFTDIMTTIVMIFLIAMVVLLLRNMELVNQLRSTMEAEQIAAELARATGEEKDSLSMALNQSQRRTLQMQLELKRLREKAIHREALITEQIGNIADLTNQRDDLSQQAAQLTLTKRRLNSEIVTAISQLLTANDALASRETELSSARNDINNLKANIDSLQVNLNTSQDEADALHTQLSIQTQTLAKNSQSAQLVERKYALLTGDFDNLKVKYDKLVRPARSTNGRHIVEVRYSKENGKYVITWHENDKGNFQSITRVALNNVLSRLAKEHKNGLYIKVIFPEKAGLSYNEAWEFTNHLHRKYDYYFKAEQQ